MAHYEISVRRLFPPIPGTSRVGGVEKYTLYSGYDKDLALSVVDLAYRWARQPEVEGLPQRPGIDVCIDDILVVCPGGYGRKKVSFDGARLASAFISIG